VPRWSPRELTESAEASLRRDEQTCVLGRPNRPIKTIANAFRTDDFAWVTGENIEASGGFKL
jgi:hypothetical protein